MKKSELRKLIKEVISENQSQILSEQSGPPTPGVALPPTFYEEILYVRLVCPSGYEFQDNLPSGGSNPQLYTSQDTLQNNEELVVSKCVPKRPETSPVRPMGMTKPSRPGKTPKK